MFPTLTDESFTVYHGSNLDVLPTLPDNSVDSIVTDPPYELGFMGKSWDSSGIAYSVELWSKCLRVLKPGGHLLAFGGSRTWHRLAVAIEDAGFEVRDSIAWLYGSGFPKSHNLDGDWKGWGTALKPAFEPVVVARKPFKGTVAGNMLKWGVGGLNIDGSRIAGEVPSVPQPRFGVSDGVYEFGSGEGRSGEMSQAVGGRWPANIILDPYTAELLDEQSGILKSGGGNKGRNPNADWVYAGGWKRQDSDWQADSGGASRFFYVAKASKRDRNEGLEGIEPQSIGAKGNGLARTCATCNASVIEGCDCPDRTFVNPTRQNFHPTVKPTSLMEYLIKLVTPEGGIVLDPFTGSGSTGKAALLNDYQFIGIELTEEYLPIIKGRLEWANKEKKDTIF